MRKSFVYIALSVLLGLASLTFYGCNRANTYALTVDGENDLLYEPLRKSYSAGETVTVKTHLLCDASIVATINGEPLRYKLASENGSFTHGEFTFTMPNKNSVLELKTENGFLPPPVGLDSKIAYYDFSVGGSYSGDFRMNAYVPSLQIWENMKPLLPTFASNYDETFFGDNALLVLCGVRGSCEDRKIESANVTLSNYTITVTISAEKLPFGTAVPTAMADWVVVLEIENNIAFSNITVNTDF